MLQIFEKSGDLKNPVQFFPSDLPLVLGNQSLNHLSPVILCEYLVRVVASISRKHSLISPDIFREMLLNFS